MQPSHVIAYEIASWHKTERRPFPQESIDVKNGALSQVLPRQ